MRPCEFCGAAVDEATNICTGCGAPQSTPGPAAASAPTPHMTAAQAVQQAVHADKPKGSVGCLIGLAIVFWPAAIVYYFLRRWK